MKRQKTKQRLHPIMSYLILMVVVIVLSWIFGILDFQSTYYKINSVSFDMIPQTEVVNSILNLSGIKYIFTNTVSNFANFTVLSNLIIILIGMSLMDKSGFLKTAITITTKKLKKKTVTFIFVLLCILSSVMGEISYLIFLPFGAYLFYYGKRNPKIGLITAFASLTIGSAINPLFTSLDSTLSNYTLLAASTIDSSYVLSTTSLFIIMLVSTCVISLLITYVTENIIAKNSGKYEFDETILEDDLISKKEHKGMKFALIAATIYLVIFIYNIIPNLPLSGALLDNSQTLYIDKLFSANSFFSNGFVFIVTILFIILGLFFGIGSKSIKNNKDFCDYLSHSIDGIGNTLIMIFMASTLISIFKLSNIGNVIVSEIGTVISSCQFEGLPLIILIFILVFISSLFVPSMSLKWNLLSATIVPTALSAGISPEFVQVIYSFAGTSSLGLTPLLAYFVVYLSFLEKYNQSSKKIRIIDSIKYQIPYVVICASALLIIIILWYILNIPLGINVYPTV